MPTEPDVTFDLNRPRPRKKIVRIIGRLNVGGPARQACFLHLALRDHFETVLVVGRLDENEGDMSYLLPSEEGVRRVPSMSRPVRLWSDLRAFISILRCLHQERPDLVHTHAAKAGTLGRLAATLLHIPVIHTYHGHVFHGYFGNLQTRTWLAIERGLGRITSRVVTISETQAGELVEKYKIAPRQKLCVIPNGYDLSRFGSSAALRERSQLRRSFGFDDSHFVVLWAGRLVPIKNVELLAEVVRQSQRSPRLRFLVVGDGTDRKKLETLTSECSNIQLAGWRKDMPEMWAAVDAGMVTSKNEGTPSALIEAMASGKPFVSTNVGGVIDLAAPPIQADGLPSVIRASNGFLTPCQADTIVHCLELLAGDPGVSVEMGGVGRSFALQRYSASRLLSDIDALYCSLLHSDQAATVHQVPPALKESA